MIRKRIAVFICAICLDNQKRVLKGVIEEAEKRNIDVFVFTCHVNYEQSERSKAGAFEVMNLPDLKAFEGIILMKNTIQNSKVADSLLERIKESRVPSVSIEEELSGMHFVGVSNYDAQAQVVQHVLMHGAKSFVYVAGLATNKEGADRLLAFWDQMRASGCDKQARVIQGNYSMESGRAAARILLKEDQLPDAVICGNDAMAMGVIEVFQKEGIRIPEDMIVTGFDHDEMSDYFLPSLTTVGQNQEEMGAIAMSLLEEPMEKPQRRLVEARLYIGESCGCKGVREHSKEDLRRVFCNKSMTISEAADSIQNMSTRFGDCENWNDLYEQMKYYVSRSDMESFFLCMREEGKTVSLPLVYRHGKFSTEPSFSEGVVLPREWQQEGKCSWYIVLPLYYQDYFFGYCISENSRFSLESELTYLWVGSIEIAMENIRKLDTMNQLVSRLEEVWKYDSMTKLYNRAGFYNELPAFLEKEEKKVGYFLLFVDLDGLKVVNDNLGHEAGDHYIQSMAKILQRISQEHSCLVMRYGGDEFVLLGGMCKDDALGVREIVSEIKREVKKVQTLGQQQYPMSCSIGYSQHNLADMDSLAELIECADQNMYRAKKRKRRGRSEEKKN